MLINALIIAASFFEGVTYEDGIEVVDICDKNIFEGADREGTWEVGVHCSLRFTRAA